MYLSGLRSCAIHSALITVSDSRLICFALVGAPTFFNVFTMLFQSCPCSFAIIMEPIPHFSPCNPIPGASLSSACEKRCSAPEHGLLLPAIQDATPALINASTTTLASNPFFANSEEFSIIIFALIMAKSAAYRP